MKKYIFIFVLTLLFSLSFSPVFAMGHSNGKANHPNVPERSIGKVSPNAAHGMHTAWKNIQNSNGNARHVFQMRFKPVGHPEPECESGLIDPQASGAEATDNSNGTLTLKISVLDECGDGIDELDPLTDFYVYDSVIGGPYYFGTDSIPGSTIDEWEENDGVYTVTLERNYFDTRPAGYEDGWYRVWDIYVLDKPVEEKLELSTSYWAVGNWEMDLYVDNNLNERFVVIDSHVEGEDGVLGFFGEGYDPEGLNWGTITGTIDGRDIYILYERTDIQTDYTAEFYGTVATDGDSMSGTWTDYDRGGVSQTWSMARQ